MHNIYINILAILYIDINISFSYNFDMGKKNYLSEGGAAMAAVSKAQQKAVNKYVREKYDRILITMPKGQKEVIQAAAEAAGLSVNAFINLCIQEHMEKTD